MMTKGTPLTIAKSAVAADKECTTQVTFQDLYEAMGTSFAGSGTIAGEPIMEWLTNHIDFEEGDAKQKLVTFLTAIFLESNLRNKRHLTLAKKQGDEIKAIARIVECNARRKHAIERLAEKFVETPQRIAFNMRLIKQQGGFPEVFTSPKYKREMEILMQKLDSVQRVLETTKKHAPTSYYWHLSGVAVSPVAQEQGIGGQLMRKLSELADAQQVDCFVVVGTEKNKAWYERYGYKAVAKKVVPDKEGAESLTIYSMIRSYRDTCEFQ